MYPTTELQSSFHCLLADKTFHVLGFTARQQINQIDYVDAILICENTTIDALMLLNTPAYIELEHSSGIVRQFHGIITYIHHLHSEKTRDETIVSHYNITLHAKLWHLSQNIRYRILSQISIPQALEMVTQPLQAKVNIHEPPIAFEAKEMRMQYQESDLAYLKRLSYEGGFVFVTPTHQNATTIHFFHHKSLNAQFNIDAPFSLSHSADDLWLSHVYAFSTQHRLNSGDVKITAYNQNNHNQALSTQIANHKKCGAVQLYNPGTYSLQELEQQSSHALQAHTSHCTLFSGVSTFTHLSPLTKLRLKQHIHSDFNKSYMVYSVKHYYLNRTLASRFPTAFHQPLDCLSHTFSKPQQVYENYFQCIAEDQSYLPPLDVPIPKISSLLNAKVITTNNQEIQQDNKGRTLVQFYFGAPIPVATSESAYNHANEALAWVRTNQHWAQHGYGQFMAHRKGTEVLVAFLDANPDYPVIVGSVYSPSNPSFSDWGQNNTVWGVVTQSLGQMGRYHEISLNDQAHAEKVTLKSAKDMDIIVQDTLSVGILKDRKTAIAKGHDITVLSQGDQITGIEQGHANLTLQQGNYTVTLSQGNLKIEAKAGIHIESHKDIHFLAKENMTFKSEHINLLANTIGINAGTLDIKTTALTIDATTTISISAGITVTLDFPGKTQLFPMTS